MRGGCACTNPRQKKPRCRKWQRAFFSTRRSLRHTPSPQPPSPNRRGSSMILAGCKSLTRSGQRTSIVQAAVRGSKPSRASSKAVRAARGGGASRAGSERQQGRGVGVGVWGSKPGSGQRGEGDVVWGSKRRRRNGAEEGQGERMGGSGGGGAGRTDGATDG